MAEEIRRCWAYNKEGARCDHPAGHPGDHAITQTWKDSECYAPSAPATPKTNISLPIPEPTSNKCAACSHSHRSGECKCGCYEHIG